MIILVNSAVFVFQIILGPGNEDFITLFGVIPAKYFWLAENHPEFYLERFFPLMSSVFLHGGFMHILGNMWFLWIFGDNVEDELGHARFLLFYVLSGLGAGLAHVYLHPDSVIPTIGASGAVAGVMGAYFWMFPKSRVITLIPVLLFFPIIEVPAVFFLGFWFVIQFLQGTLSLGSDPDAGGVAWWAHLGGFLAGALLGIIMKKRK